MKLHSWVKVKMTDTQKQLGFDLYKCDCGKSMNLSGYASQGMPEIHYEKCKRKII